MYIYILILHILYYILHYYIILYIFYVMYVYIYILSYILTSTNTQPELIFSLNLAEALSACYRYIKESSSHKFKTTGEVFILKTDMTCQSGNLICAVICSSCNEEYTVETEEGTNKLRDRVRVYMQHICQPNYQQLKCEEHF